MPLLAVLDEGAHGALDESLKGLYVQNTDTKEYHLDIAPDEAAKLAHNLRTQFEAKKTDLNRVHGEKTALATKLKAFEDLGKTADEIKAAIESNRPEEVNKLLADSQAKHQAEVEQLRKSFEEPLATAQEKAKKYEAEIQKSLTTSAIQTIRNQFDLNETADYVLRDYLRAVPKEEGSDEYVVKVFENGAPAMVAGQEMKPDQLIKRFQEEKKFLPMFNAGKDGGTGGTNRQTAGGSGTKYAELPPTERLNAAREAGVTT
jgi:DNA-binding transcriptional MerR regulator